MSGIRKLLLWAAGIGLVPFPLGYAVPSSIHLALIAPSLLSILTFRSLKDLPFRTQLLWCFVASACTTGIFTLIVGSIGLFNMGSVQVAFGILPSPFWLPWLLMFSVSPIAACRLWSASPPIWRWPIAAAMSASLYALSFATCFNISDRTIPPDVEHPNALGREPALGPRVSPVGRLICPPRGPSFLFSSDYNGTEWLWKVYQPFIQIWFARPRSKYYYPYATGAAWQYSKWARQAAI